MVAQLQVEIPDELFAAVMTDISGEIQADLVKLMLKAANVAAGHVKQKIQDLLTKDPTGALARSVTTEVVSQAKAEPEVLIGPTLPYGEIQDQGGKITMKGKRLAVPLPGVPRGKWPRDWAPDALTLIPRKGRAPLLAEVSVRGKKRDRFGNIVPNAKITPRYVLLTSVTITGVGYMAAAQDAMEGDVADVLEKGIVKILEKDRKNA